MKITIKILLMILFIFVGSKNISVFAGNLPANPVSVPNYWDFLIQKVCEDQNGNFLPIDPYNCPTQDRVVPLKPGQVLPYHRWNQQGTNRRDSFPVLMESGEQVVVSTTLGGASNSVYGFDELGINPLNLSINDQAVSSHYWASIKGTTSTNSFGTTWFGEGGNPYGGWISFPVDMVENAYLGSGYSNAPIQGVWYEQDGQPAPGVAGPNYGVPLTTWNSVSNFHFSGQCYVNQTGATICNPVKTLPAILSITGYRNNTNFLQNGHLEAFYFTQLYGETRWEAWRPSSQLTAGTVLAATYTKEALKAVSFCSPGIGTLNNGMITMMYQGVNFTMTACADWSAVVPVSPIDQSQPRWPVPDFNLLRNNHFTDPTFDVWQVSDNLSVKLVNSSLSGDIVETNPQSKGLRYLTLTCSGTCTMQQTIPLPSSMVPGHVYPYPMALGVIARTESNTEMNTSGNLILTIKQLDFWGNVVDPGQPVTVTVGSNLQVLTSAHPSILLASTLVPNVPVAELNGKSTYYEGAPPMFIKISPYADRLAFVITVPAISSGLTFDIVEAYLTHVRY